MEFQKICLICLIVLLFIAVVALLWKDSVNSELVEKHCRQRNKITKFFIKNGGAVDLNRALITPAEPIDGLPTPFTPDEFSQFVIKNSLDSLLMMDDDEPPPPEQYLPPQQPVTMEPQQQQKKKVFSEEIDYGDTSRSKKKTSEEDDQPMYEPPVSQAFPQKSSAIPTKPLPVPGQPEPQKQVDPSTAFSEFKNNRINSQVKSIEMDSEINYERSSR